MSTNTPEPMPQKNNHPAIWDLVIADMQERDQSGQTKYNTRLQPFNGRNALIDAYQEALDLVVYLRQKIYEEEHSCLRGLKGLEDDDCPQYRIKKKGA